MSQVDIVIPAYNCADYTVRCLRSVAAHTDNYRVILIDNGSDPDQREQILAALAELPHKLITNKENLGFVKATNQGITASRSAPYVCLLNNDTEVRENWVAMLLEPFRDSQCGIVGPAATQGGWQARQQRPSPSKYQRLGALNLAFFCALISRRVIKRVGLLDEGYGMGFGDDDDYCERVKAAGFRLYFRRDLVITHNHRTTFERHIPNWREAQRENIARFTGKWGRRP